MHLVSGQGQRMGVNNCCYANIFSHPCLIYAVMPGYIEIIQLLYLFLSSRCSLQGNLSLAGFASFISRCNIFSAIFPFCSFRREAEWPLSLWTTPIASQSRRTSGGGDGGLLSSDSAERSFRSCSCEESVAWWGMHAWVAAGTIQVSGTGKDSANRILNSWSNESIICPLRTVMSCRCRWTSLHVRLKEKPKKYSGSRL